MSSPRPGSKRDPFQQQMDRERQGKRARLSAIEAAQQNSRLFQPGGFLDSQTDTQDFDPALVQESRSGPGPAHLLHVPLDLSAQDSDAVSTPGSHTPNSSPTPFKLIKQSSYLSTIANSSPHHPHNRPRLTNEQAIPSHASVKAKSEAQSPTPKPTTHCRCKGTFRLDITGSAANGIDTLIINGEEYKPTRTTSFVLDESNRIKDPISTSASDIQTLSARIKILESDVEALETKVDETRKFAAKWENIAWSFRDQVLELEAQLTGGYNALPTSSQDGPSSPSKGSDAPGSYPGTSQLEGPHLSPGGTSQIPASFLLNAEERQHLRDLEEVRKLYSDVEHETGSQTQRERADQLKFLYGPAIPSHQRSS